MTVGHTLKTGMTRNLLEHSLLQGQASLKLSDGIFVRVLKKNTYESAMCLSAIYLLIYGLSNKHHF